MDLFFQDATSILKLCTWLFVIGQILSSIEFYYLIFSGNYSSNGYCPWNIISLEKPIIYNYSWLDRLFKVVYSNWGQKVLIVLQLLFLVSLAVTPVKSLAYTISIFGLLAFHFLMHFRNPYGGEGSDQMSIIVMVGLCIGASSFSNQTMSLYSILFIALQSVLSYGAAGIAKLVSTKWRKGVAVYEIFNTGSYGHKDFALIISKNNKLGFCLSWSVIVMECAFPLTLLFPSPIVLFVFLLWGIVFHFFNAIIMGLNAFFWIFLSTYPCIIYLFYQLHQ